MASSPTGKSQKLPKQNRRIKLPTGGLSIRALQQRGLTGGSIDAMDAAKAAEDDVDTYIEDAAI